MKPEPMNIKSVTSIVVLAAASLFITSCRKNTDAPAPSQFVKEVGLENLKSAEPPLVPPVFRWDFSGNKAVHTYSYEQEVKNKTDMGRSFGGSETGAVGQEMSAKGQLLIKSQGDSTAEFVLKDIKMNMKIDTGEAEPRTIGTTAPSKENPYSTLI